MLHKKQLMLIFVLLATFLAVGCSSDKDKNPTGSDNTRQTPDLMTLSVPVNGMMTSGNQYAGQAAGYIAMAKGFASLFDPPDNAGKLAAQSGAAADSIVWIWTVQQLTIKLIFKETSTDYSWTITYNGFNNGYNYVDWVVIAAQQNKDRSSGWLNLYNDNTTDLDIKWEWTRTGSGVYTIIMTSYAPDDLFTFKIFVNSSTTGYVEYYENSIIIWKLTWAGTSSQCSGYWYEYINGVFSASGSWFYSAG